MANSNQPQRLISLYLFVKDLTATIRFYESLGLDVEHVSDQFARGSWNGDAVLEFGTAALTRSYDPAWQESEGLSKVTINFELGSRESVDAMYEKLVADGFIGHLAPCDPLWQARFAIVEDPDGNYVGLHSQRNGDADRARERGGNQ